MKKTLIIVLLLVIVFPVFASYKVFMNDVAIRLGHGAFFDDKVGGIHVLAGLSIGLTERIEFDPEVIVPLAPKPFEKINAGFEFSYALLGNRVNKNGVAGANLNSLISLGFFTENLKPEYITLRIVPLTHGMPSFGTRESLLPIGVAWNFKDHTFSCFMSIAIFDHYVKGTWAQLRNESGE